MSYQFSISDMGLRLIKAYEGYVPDGRLMRDGRKIVGYGRVTSDLNMVVSQSDASTMLKDDLASIEDMVNTNIHASMTQSQFDALCSLAYSIGPKAFLSSTVLHAMNRGEVISAANGFDGWRLGNIDGQIYVVDALVRRRTAEKALFLRPSLRTVPAPHEALPALQDDRKTSENVAKLSNAVRAEQSTNSNVVSLYSADESPSQATQEDLTFEGSVESSAGAVDEGLGESLDESSDPAEILTLTTESDGQYNSPIAEAAAEVSERLDALMDKNGEKNDDSWPESLVEQEEPPIEFPIDDPAIDDVSSEYSNLENNDDYLEDGNLKSTEFHDEDGRYASADKYIQPGTTTAKQNLWTFVTMIVLGLSAAIGGFWANMKSSMFFGDLSPLIWSAGVAIGVLLFLMGLYYLSKQLFGKAGI